MDKEKHNSFNYLVEHFPDYPCRKCKRKDADVCHRALSNVQKRAGNQSCVAYKAWFFKTWKELKKRYRKEQTNEKV